MFQVGQKVICVDDAQIIPSSNPIDQIPLECGSIYTVRWIGPQYFSGLDKIVLSVRLEETLRPFDYPFGADRFRPVVERKTDISVFTRMLTPHDEKVGA